MLWGHSSIQRDGLSYNLNRTRSPAPPGQAGTFYCWQNGVGQASKPLKVKTASSVCKNASLKHVGQGGMYATGDRLTSDVLGDISANKLAVWMLKSQQGGLRWWFESVGDPICTMVVNK